MATNDQELGDWLPVGKVEEDSHSTDFISTDDESTGQRARHCKNKKIAQVELNIEKIISKNKSESMFELRRLSHHQHPVSLFSGKMSLEEHLAHHKPSSKAAALQNIMPSGASTELRDSESEASALNFSEQAQQLRPETEAKMQESFRPSNITLEMQNLTEQRIVNVLLQEVGEDIERTLRENMEQQRSRQHQRPRAQQSRRREDGDEGGDEMSHTPAPPAGRLLSAGAHNRRHRGSSRRARFRPQPPTPNADGRYPIPRRDQSSIVSQLRQSSTLNSLGEEVRDEVVAEVSNLVSQQLVTSALSGEFRGILEVHIQSRADQMNRGRVSPSLGQQLGHRDNSYQAAEQHNMDSDREVPRSSHDVRELREEMVSMKGQLNELKQMMRLSFDLQLDIQRAIRQEVSAALAAFLVQPNQGVSKEGGAHFIPNSCPIPTLSPQRDFSLVAVGGERGDNRAKVVDSGHCVICSEGVIDSVIYHCGHMCTCIACGMELKSKALKCPICRAPIIDVIRAYSSMLEEK